VRTVPPPIPIVPRPWSSDDGDFDDYGSFVPEHLPDPGPFLDGHRVLTGRDHAAFHRLIVFIVTVYRWFADPFRRTTGNDLR
jgi:hypothetical protein